MSIEQNRWRGYQYALSLSVAFWRVENDLNSAAETVPGLREDRDFQTPLGGELEDVKPEVVRRLFGIQPLGIAGVEWIEYSAGSPS